MNRKLKIISTFFQHLPKKRRSFVFNYRNSRAILIYFPLSFNVVFFIQRKIVARTSFLFIFLFFMYHFLSFDAFFFFFFLIIVTLWCLHLYVYVLELFYYLWTMFHSLLHRQKFVANSSFIASTFLLKCMVVIHLHFFYHWSSSAKRGVGV